MVLTDMSIGEVEVTCRWIEFVKTEPAAKTNRWLVTLISNGEVLGVVKWHGRWRRYAFFPNGNGPLEHECLIDIADFCVAQTTAKRVSSGKVLAASAA